MNVALVASPPSPLKPDDPFPATVEIVPPKALDVAIIEFRIRKVVATARRLVLPTLVISVAPLRIPEDLVDELVSAGESSGERCWPLPLWDVYREQLDSETADLLNVGGRPAGAITAAIFLSEFVGEVPWAHLDIAGTAYGDGKLPYQRKGAYGFPTRMLIHWVRSRAG